MRLLKTLIGDLDAMSRALVLLHLEGFDHAEIAALMGLGVSNVATRLSRIRQRLKAQAIEGGMT
jgi:RNA polymerase sigma-70 factor (ECF subfamily)